MSDVNQETLDRFITLAEQVLAALPIVASTPSTDSTSTSLINMSEIVGYGDTADPSISHITEIVSYEPVYLIKTNDYIIGGANGIANLQARALVGRDNFLNKKIDDLSTRVNTLDKEAGGGDSTYSELLAQLKSLDVSIFKRQISQLERQNMINAIAMKSADMDSGENGMIVEVFRNDLPTSIDQTNGEVVVVVPGDDSVDITDARSLIIGGVYQLSDGEKSEEVQIKENLGTIENGYRVLFTTPVVNSYKNNKARLYRSSAEIADNRAYGGGILREKTWNANIDFTGTNNEDTNV